VPRTRARPNDSRLIFDVVDPPYCAPGASNITAGTPFVVACDTADCADPKISEKFMPNLASTITVIVAEPTISNTALMICHPRRPLHAADQDVDNHQDTDRRDDDRLARRP